MLELIQNKDRLPAMSQNARKNIVEKYQRQNIWDEMLNLYQSLEKN